MPPVLKTVNEKFQELYVGCGTEFRFDVWIKGRVGRRIGIYDRRRRLNFPGVVFQ